MNLILPRVGKGRRSNSTLVPTTGSSVWPSSSSPLSLPLSLDAFSPHRYLCLEERRWLPLPSDDFVVNLVRMGVSGSSKVSRDFLGPVVVGEEGLSLSLGTFVAEDVLVLTPFFRSVLFGDEVVEGRMVDGGMSTGSKTSVNEAVDDPRVIC